MNIDDNYQELLEKEIRVQEALKAARKAQQEAEEQLLGKEVRIQESIKAAREADIANQKKHGKAVSLDDKRGLRLFPTFMSAAAVLLFIVFGTWQYDVLRTRTAAEYGLSYARSTDDIQLLLDAKEYDQAMEMIDKELARPFNPDVYPEESRAQAQSDHEIEQQDLQLKKACILLMQGEKKEAREILKALDTDEAKEILDRLFLPW